MISSEEYQKRRRLLTKMLPAGSVAIIGAASEVLRNGDAHYRFRQDSNFYYLTGFSEPDSLLVLMANGESYLFSLPKDPAKELWTGARLGQDAAKQKFNLSEAFPLDMLNTILPSLLIDKSAIYYVFSNQNTQSIIQMAVTNLKSQARRGQNFISGYFDLEPIIGELRLFKSEAEIGLIQQAVNITVLAHKRAMQVARRKTFEYELEAELIYEFYRHGARYTAYDSIVAAGSSACTLHYTDNNQALNKGDLVLIDAGAEYENYAADITRTFPVTGHFSDEQRKLYQLVLDSQQAAIACIKPGIAFGEIQATIVKYLTEGLWELGILKGNLEDLIQNKAYIPFYMHNSGHWLGLDVHDSGKYTENSKSRLLEENMVLTVEPGLYISESISKIDKRWLGIGIRIEDDIVVTKDGCRVLSEALPSKLDEIEALMGE